MAYLEESLVLLECLVSSGEGEGWGRVGRRGWGRGGRRGWERGVGQQREEGEV